MKKYFAILAISIAMLSNAAAQNAFHAPTDKNGYYSVLSCPTSPSYFSATTELNEDDGSYNVNIYHGRQLAQSINCDVTGGELHFLDANFDGNLDIVVGPATARNYSTILLWSDAEQEFVETGLELNGYFLVNPKSKTWVEMSSNGASSTFYRIYNWKGNNLEAKEMLMVLSDPGDYAEYGANTIYTVVKGGDFYGAKTGAAKKRTNQLTKLPKQWQQIIDSFDNMEQ